MKIIVSFRDVEDVEVVIYREGRVFMISPLRLDLPPEPYYRADSPYSATKKEYQSWCNKVQSKILKSVANHFNQDLYGFYDIEVKGLGDKLKEEKDNE